MSKKLYAGGRKTGKTFFAFSEILKMAKDGNKNILHISNDAYRKRGITTEFNSFLSTYYNGTYERRNTSFVLENESVIYFENKECINSNTRGIKFDLAVLEEVYKKEDFLSLLSNEFIEIRHIDGLGGLYELKKVY